jgi:hypothetical protein
MATTIVPFRSLSENHALSDPGCADTHSRRRILTLLAVAPMMAAGPTVTLAGEDGPIGPSDPHPEWARQAAAIAAQLDTPGLIADDDTGPFCERMCGFYDLIAETPARTLIGVREQVALVADSIFHNQPGEMERAALANALATLDQLAGGPVHG